MEDAYADEDGYAEVLLPAGDADLAAYVHADGHGLDLFDGRLYSAHHRTIAYVGVGDDMLALSGHDGGLENFRKDVQEFPAKVYSHRANAFLGQLFAELILISSRFREGHAERRAAYISTLIFPIGHISFPVL